MRRSRRDIPSFHLSTPSLPPGPWLNGTAVKTVLWLSGAALKRPRSRFNARFAEIEGDIAFFFVTFFLGWLKLPTSKREFLQKASGARLSAI